MTVENGLVVFGIFVSVPPSQAPGLMTIELG